MVEVVAALVSKVASRPSTVWRLAWLVFCLLVLCFFFGAATLGRIVPYVLAGVDERPRRQQAVASGESDDGSRVAWALPCLAWSAMIVLVAWAVLR